MPRAHGRAYKGVCVEVLRFSRSTSSWLVAHRSSAREFNLEVHTEPTAREPVRLSGMAVLVRFIWNELTQWDFREYA